MILRNVAIRHGRKALAITTRRSWPKSLSTETVGVETSMNEAGSLDEAFDKLRVNGNFAPPTDGVDFTVAEDFRLLKQIKKRTAKLGSVVPRHYEPHHLITHPPSPKDITLELLMASQSQLGHATSLWNPANQRYIYGIRDGIHIISLEETAAHLRRAAKVVEGVAYHGGLILFVGTRAGQDQCVVRAAEMAKGCHLFQRWTPGTITNGNQILGRCSVKVLDKDDQPLEGFEEKLENWNALKPDLVVVLNPVENYTLLHECGLNYIPTIGIIDTNADPTWVTYPIPANDDSLRCVQVVAGVLGRAGEAGQIRRLEDAKNGVITWEPPPHLGSPATKELEGEAKEQGTATEETPQESGQSLSKDDKNEDGL